MEDSLKLAQEELQKCQKRYKKYYDRKVKPRCLEVGEQVLILLMQWRGPYIVESCVVHTSNKDDVTIAVARAIYIDIDPEMWEVPDLEGYHQKEGVQDVKLIEDLLEDQHRMLKDFTRKYPDVFTDMHRETDVIQHRVKLTDDTPICSKPYPLQHALAARHYGMKWTVC